MKYSQKYSIAGFLEHHDNGCEFTMSDWPLHVTLADVFAINRIETEIEDKLTEALQSQGDVIVQPKQHSKLGDTDVVLIEKTDELVQLHILVISLLEQNGAIFNTPAFTRDGFLPHCTIQRVDILPEGAKITELALVDMFPDNNWRQRKILNTFELGGERRYR